MSSPGYFYEPADAEQAEAFRRKRAYADALLREREPQGQYGGLAGAGQKIAAALLAKNADKGAKELADSASSRYSQALASFLGGGNGQLPTASTTPQMDENGALMPQSPAPVDPSSRGALARLLATNNPALI